VTKRISTAYSTLKALAVAPPEAGKRVEFKLGNPSLLYIPFRMLNTGRLMMEYAERKNILYVMEVFGHRNMKEHSHPYTVGRSGERMDILCSMVAKTVELIEAGIMHAESTVSDF